MTTKLAVHVIDQDHRRRAHLAQCVFAMGHHAEVYSNIDEIVAHLPRDGVVIMQEDALAGGIPELVDLFERGEAAPAVIATSSCPSIEKAVEAIRHGAFDYIPLPFEVRRMARAIEDAARANGERACQTRPRTAAREAIGVLSPRELEHVGLIALGLTNRQIAARLGISSRTVENHRANVLAKLAVGNSAAVVRLYCASGLPTA